MRSGGREMSDRGDKYVTVFESLMVPVLLLDAEGRIDNFNEAAALLFGIGAVSDPADGVPMSSGDLFAPLRDDIENFSSGRALEHGFERAISTAVGVKYFQVRLKRIRDVSGVFLGTAVVLSDITERKAIEDEILESRAQYRALFENMDDAFARHSAVVDESGEAVDYVFLEVNPAFERAFGVKSSEIVGRRASEVWAEQPFD